MSINEFSDQFDLLYNNITSNQAPGLNQYEKSVFLTKAQNELVKNYFSPKGNIKQDGFDDTPKRQADFSTLIRSVKMDIEDQTSSNVTSNVIDLRTTGVYNSQWPSDVFIMLNEMVFNSSNSPFVVVPLSYEEYSRLMAKPYKYPPKYQVWRLITNNNQSNEDIQIGTTGTTTSSTSSNRSTTTYNTAVKVQLIGKNVDTSKKYTLRFIKKPRPIILEDFSGDNLSIDGQNAPQTSELPAELHEEILQRAVELAKVAWTATGQDNLQAVLETGKRSE